MTQNIYTVDDVKKKKRLYELKSATKNITGQRNI